MSTHQYCHKLVDMLMQALMAGNASTTKTHLEWLFTLECEYAREGLLLEDPNYE